MERAGNESSFALCRLKLEEPMFRKMQDPWALTYSAKKTKDGKNSGIKVISSPESFLSFLRFPSSLPPRNEGTIKMEYKGEPLPEKIPWEGEFTLRSDP